MLNLIGVILAFIVVIILIRKKINFGLSLIIGSILVSIFSLFHGIALTNVLQAFIEGSIYSFKNPTNNIYIFENQQISIGFSTGPIQLAILLTLIFILAKCMQETGVIKKMIESLQTIFYKGGTLAAIPAIYGLMPVPGGALFSAPLIDKEGSKYHLDQDKKNFLNVWFRHIWFPIFPVSSAMMLIIGKEYSNIDIYELIAANTLAFIAYILIGVFYLKLYLNDVQKPKKKPKKEYHGLLFLIPPTIPIILYIIAAVIFIILDLENLKNYQITIFILGTLLSIFSLYFLIKIEWKKYKDILKKSFSLKLAFIIFGIMIFRETIDTSQANVILTSLISDLPFHPILIILLIPLIMGLITGYNLGAIALSYLLIQPFFAATEVNIVGITSLIFISSLAGYLISPIHLCNIVSSDNLKTEPTRMYKMYIPAIIMFLVIHTVFIVIFY